MKWHGFNTFTYPDPTDEDGEREFEVAYEYWGYHDPGRMNPPDLAYPPESEHEVKIIHIIPEPPAELRAEIEAATEAYSKKHDDGVDEC